MILKETSAVAVYNIYYSKEQGRAQTFWGAVAQTKKGALS